MIKIEILRRLAMLLLPLFFLAGYVKRHLSEHPETKVECLQAEVELALATTILYVLVEFVSSLFI